VESIRRRQWSIQKLIRRIKTADMPWYFLANTFHKTGDGTQFLLTII
jgi:hypothetical protein